MENNIYQAEGFDDAIIGVDYNTGRIAYSLSKCISIIMLNEEMSELDAIEWFDFKVSRVDFGTNREIYSD